MPFWVAFVVLALITLACGSAETGARPASKRVTILKHLPTLTPTVSSNPAPAAVASAPAGDVSPLAPSPANAVAIPAASGAAPLHLPTLTPTPVSISGENSEAPAASAASPPPAAADSPPPAAADSPPPTATDSPPPAAASDPIDNPTAAPIPEASNWSFANTQLYPDPYGGGLLLYGEMVNNANSSQELTLVSGVFYDAQGQLIADQENIIDYWPIDIVPPGGRMPFELTVLEVENAANFDLSVQSQPSEQSPHQNFEFSDLDQLSEEGIYCLTGQLRNLGGPLQKYVVIMAVLYDEQDRMLGFGEYYEPDPKNGLSDQSLEFELCAELINQNVARHELRAWGE